MNDIKKNIKDRLIHELELCDLMLEIKEYQDNIEAAPVFQDMTVMPEMLAKVMDYYANAAEKLDRKSPEDIAIIKNFYSFVLLMKKFSNDLKPFYLKVLLMEASQNGDKT